MEILLSCIINYEKQQLVQSYKTAIISDINIFSVSKLTLELGFVTTIAFSFTNIPKTLHDRTHLSVVYDS
jgi:hypothetical protein